MSDQVDLGVRVLRDRDDRPLLPLVDGEGEARAIVWPGIGATMRSLHRIVLARGARTHVQRHPSEAVYHVNAGAAVIEDLDTGQRNGLVVGSMIHIDAGTRYRFHSGADDTEILGGPCPADPALYDAPPSTGDEIDRIDEIDEKS